MKLQLALDEMKTEEAIKLVEKVKDYIDIIEANKIIQDSHPEFERYKSAGRFVYKDYTREEITKLLELIDERAEGATYTAITFYGLGGVIKEVKSDSTAFYHRDAQFILGFQSVWEEPRFAPVNRKWRFRSAPEAWKSQQRLPHPQTNRSE